ncbi:MAG: GGDEF domain-containing protein [Thiolinea sp.]
MLIIETILAIFLGASLVSGLLFFMASRIPGGFGGHNGWILSTLIAICGIVLALSLIAQNRPDLASMATKVAGIGWSTAFYQGTMLFVNRPQNRGLLVVIALVLSGLIIYLQYVRQAYFQAALVFSLYCAAINFILAWRIFKADCDNCRRLSHWLSGVLLLHALHLLDFPFLHGHPILGPIGFVLALMITTAINLLLVALVIQKSRAQLEKSTVAAQTDAACDPLTGLLNRTGLQQAFLAKTVSLKREQRAHALLLLFIDLDKFKHINDQFGHRQGDLVLKTVARRLRANTSAEWDQTARYGGDEFIILLEFDQQPIPEADAGQICQRLLHCIAQPIVADGSVHRITGSIGISCYPQHGTDLEELLMLADAAMYQAKQAGTGQYRLPACHP